MPDVTGQTYESFVEFLLRRLGVRDEHTPGAGAQYFYENDTFQATCHTSTTLCAHAAECDRLTRQLGYGPWYDPDFVVTDDGAVKSVISITHWSNPTSSLYKFWRTAEEMFEYKTLFGAATQSVNLLFEAKDPEEAPEIITELNNLREFHGWKPAVGSVYALSHDITVAFPVDYLPLTTFQDTLPPQRGNTQVKRRQRLDHWQTLCDTQPSIQAAIEQATDLLRRALDFGVNARFTPEAIAHLQSVCFQGRMRATAAPLHTTRSRYRKGIQHAYLLYLAARTQFGRDDLAQQWVKHILQMPARFSRAEWDKSFSRVGQASAATPMLDALRALPVKMDQRQPIAMLGIAGMQQYQWNEDMTEFIHGLVPLTSANREAFIEMLWELFAKYDGVYGMQDIARDLTEIGRVEKKVDYVTSHYVDVRNREEFIRDFSEDLLTPGDSPQHQEVVKDIHNWLADVMLEMYGLGSIQSVTTVLPRRFTAKTGERLNAYSFMGDLGKIINHLIQGVDVSQFFGARTSLSRQEFYEIIWPLFAEVVWDAIQGKTPLPPSDVVTSYRYKKAVRIISQSDLEPIRPLMLRSVPGLDESNTTLRGVFNQLSRFKGWGQSALTTEAGGRDPRSGAYIQTQTVVGAKNIDHKVKELASRMRSLQLKLNTQGQFVPNPNAGSHYLVIDGDWPITSKVNLYEAGFTGIFEIAELDQLAGLLEK